MDTPSKNSYVYSDQTEVDITNCLIWTRPLEYWDDDKQLLTAAGMLGKTLRLPCSKTIPILLETYIQEGKRDVLFTSKKPAFAFTSAKSVELAWANTYVQQHLKKAVHIFAVGEQTKEALSKHGFSADYDPIVNNGESLSKYIAAKLDKTVPIVLPGAKIRAFDLELALTRLNFQAQKLDLYETIMQITTKNGSPISIEDHSILSKHLSGALIAGAPSVVESLKASFPPACLSRLDCYAIGLTTAKAAKGFFKAVHLGDEPKFSALLELV